MNLMDLVDLSHLLVRAVLVHLAVQAVLDRHADPLVLMDPVGLVHLADPVVLDRHPYRPFPGWKRERRKSRAGHMSGSQLN